MKSLFLRVSDKLDKIDAVIQLHQDGILTIGEIESRENEMDDDLTVLEYNGTAYEIINKDNLPENHKVLGYSRVNKKENKKIKAKIDNLVCSIDKTVAVNEKKGTFERVVGYVKVDTSTLENFDTEGKEVYVAITKFFVMPIILLFGGLALLGTIGYFNYYGLPGTEVVVPEKEKIDFVDGDKSNGEIEDEAHQFGPARKFRMKLNCTPGVEIIDEKQQMNLRLESPVKDNAGLGFVTFVYLLGEQDADGNIIEEYAEPIEIYQSPIVYADENIEWCPLHTEVESGIYVGRALYYVFDENENLIGQTASRLRITVQ